MIPDWTSYRYTAHPWRIRVALLLGLIGIAASLATIYAAPIAGATSLGCGVQALSCTKALTSEFSKIGGIPLGVFGVFYFTFWTLNLRAFQTTSNDEYLCALSWVTLAGACGSVALFSIMFFLLQAPCLYCLVTHVCNLGSFALLWPVRRWRQTAPFTTEHARHFLALTTIAVLAAVCVYLADEVRGLKARAAAREKTIW